MTIERKGVDGDSAVTRKVRVGAAAQDALLVDLRKRTKEEGKVAMAGEGEGG